MDQNILDSFKKAVNSNRLAHAYLFCGPANAGKKDAAFWLADFLKINSFDILYIVPEKDKKNISIKQIRGLKKHLSLSPYNSSYKFAIIDYAETMNLDACNALLKTLEEPSGNTILILITSKPDFLPKTIISRLQDVRFKDIPLDSKEFINKEGIELLKKPLSDVFKHIEDIYKNEAEVFSLLDSWLFWFRDLMVKDNKYIDSVKEIIKTKDLISTTNVNKRLALENLVLCIKN